MDFVVAFATHFISSSSSVEANATMGSKAPSVFGIWAWSILSSLLLLEVQKVGLLTEKMLWAINSDHI